MSQERKEWVRASHSPTGTRVTVTLQEGHLSVRWTVKSYASGLKTGVAEARHGAEKALAQLQEAVGLTVEVAA